MSTAELLTELQRVSPDELRKALSEKAKARNEILAQYDREMELIERLLDVIDPPARMAKGWTATHEPSTVIETQPISFGPTSGLTGQEWDDVNESEVQAAEAAFPTLGDCVAAVDTSVPESSFKEIPVSQSAKDAGIVFVRESSIPPPTPDHGVIVPQQEPPRVKRPYNKRPRHPEPTLQIVPPRVKSIPTPTAFPVQIATYLEAMGRQSCGLIAKHLHLDRDATESLLENDPTFIQTEGGFWDLRSRVEAKRERDLMPINQVT